MNNLIDKESSNDPYSTPHNLESGGPAKSGGSCFKTLMVWCLPAVAVPLIIGLFASSPIMGGILSLCFLIAMGKIYAGDLYQDNAAENQRRWPKVLLYLVIQVILIPLVWLALIWGFCVVTGSGKF